MDIPPITRVYTPAEMVAFKGFIDGAYAIIHPTTPSVSEGQKSGLEGVKKERHEFLSESYIVGGQQASKMPGEYNHANHLVSNNLVLVYDELITYMQPLNEELAITQLVVSDQALKPGELVLKTMLFQSTINSVYKAIHQGLSILYKKKAVHPPIITPIPPVA